MKVSINRKATTTIQQQFNQCRHEKLLMYELPKSTTDQIVFIQGGGQRLSQPKNHSRIKSQEDYQAELECRFLTPNMRMQHASTIVGSTSNLKSSRQVLSTTDDSNLEEQDLVMTPDQREQIRKRQLYSNTMSQEALPTVFRNCEQCGSFYISDEIFAVKHPQYCFRVEITPSELLCRILEQQVQSQNLVTCREDTNHLSGQDIYLAGRQKILDGVYKMALHFKQARETIHIAIELIDQYYLLQSQALRARDFKAWLMRAEVIVLHQVTVLLIASKFDEMDDNIAIIRDLRAYIRKQLVLLPARDSFTAPTFEEIVSCERAILKFFSWNLKFVLPLHVLRMLLANGVFFSNELCNHISSGQQLSVEAPRSSSFDARKVQTEWSRQISHESLSVADLVILRGSVVQRKEKSSDIAASILYLARMNVLEADGVRVPKIWPQELVILTRCQENTAKRILKDVLGSLSGNNIKLKGGDQSLANIGKLLQKDSKLPQSSLKKRKSYFSPMSPKSMKSGNQTSRQSARKHQSTAGQDRFVMKNVSLVKRQSERIISQSKASSPDLRPQLNVIGTAQTCEKVTEIACSEEAEENFDKQFELTEKLAQKGRTTRAQTLKLDIKSTDKIQVSNNSQQKNNGTESSNAARSAFKPATDFLPASTLKNSKPQKPLSHRGNRTYATARQQPSSKGTTADGPRAAYPQPAPLPDVRISEVASENSLESLHISDSRVTSRKVAADPNSIATKRERSKFFTAASKAKAEKNGPSERKPTKTDARNSKDGDIPLTVTVEEFQQKHLRKHSNLYQTLPAANFETVMSIDIEDSNVKNNNNPTVIKVDKEDKKKFVIPALQLSQIASKRSLIMQKYIDARKGAPQTTKNNVKFANAAVSSRNQNDTQMMAMMANNLSSDLKIQKRSTIQFTRSKQDSKTFNNCGANSSRIIEKQKSKPLVNSELAQKLLLDNSEAILQTLSSLSGEQIKEVENQQLSSHLSNQQQKQQPPHGHTVSVLELEKFRSDKNKLMKANSVTLPKATNANSVISRHISQVSHGGSTSALACSTNKNAAIVAVSGSSQGIVIQQKQKTAKHGSKISFIQKQAVEYNQNKSTHSTSKRVDFNEIHNKILVDNEKGLEKQPVNRIQKCATQLDFHQSVNNSTNLLPTIPNTKSRNKNRNAENIHEVEGGFSLAVEPYANAAVSLRQKQTQKQNLTKLSYLQASKDKTNSIFSTQKTYQNLHQISEETPQMLLGGSKNSSMYKPNNNTANNKQIMLSTLRNQPDKSQYLSTRGLHQNQNTKPAKSTFSPKDKKVPSSGNNFVGTRPLVNKKPSFKQLVGGGPSSQQELTQQSQVSSRPLSPTSLAGKAQLFQSSRNQKGGLNSMLMSSNTNNSTASQQQANYRKYTNAPTANALAARSQRTLIGLQQPSSLTLASQDTQQQNVQNIGSRQYRTSLVTRTNQGKTSGANGLIAASGIAPGKGAQTTKATPVQISKIAQQLPGNSYWVQKAAQQEKKTGKLSLTNTMIRTVGVADNDGAGARSMTSRQQQQRILTSSSQTTLVTAPMSSRHQYQSQFVLKHSKNLSKEPLVTQQQSNLQNMSDF